MNSIAIQSEIQGELTEISQTLNLITTILDEVKILAKDCLQPLVVELEPLQHRLAVGSRSMFYRLFLGEFSEELFLKLILPSYNQKTPGSAALYDRHKQSSYKLNNAVMDELCHKAGVTDADIMRVQELKNAADTELDESQHSDRNNSHLVHDTFRNDSSMSE